MNGTATASTEQAQDLLGCRLPLPRAESDRFDLVTTLAIFGDFAMVIVGLVLGYWIRFQSGWITLGNEPPNLTFHDYAGVIGVGAIFLLLTLGYMRLYSIAKMPSYHTVSRIILKGTTFWLFAFISMNLVMKVEPAISRIYIATSYITCLGSVLLWRYGYHKLLRCDAIAQHLRQRILYVGWTPEAQQMAIRIHHDPNRAHEVVGWIPAPLSQNHLLPPDSIQRLGDCTQLAQILKKHRVDMVILADLGLAFEEIVGLSNLCEKELVQFKIIPSYFQILLSGLKLEPISGVPILGVSELPLDRASNRILKRCVDIIGALVGLTLSAPIIALLGLLIRLESPGPILYRQIRTGRYGRNFNIIKLRSMRLDSEPDGAQWARPDDPRRLRIGVFMREWNLDELPQFWNVLKGEMSLVGPRPERPELIASFRHQVPHYNARLATKPGITGWAQVNGLRGNTSLEARVRYDIHYLENWSLWFDAQTMVQTFFKRDNAY